MSTTFYIEIPSYLFWLIQNKEMSKKYTYMNLTLFILNNHKTNACVFAEWLNCVYVYLYYPQGLTT
jgi:hypothetical protein